MTTDEKCEAVAALLALYGGGWLEMAHALLGPEERGDVWRAYQARVKANADMLGHAATSAQRWDATWMPAFWDTIQEINR